jgi:DNA-binding beta-propeller fold protein YncE
MLLVLAIVVGGALARRPRASPVLLSIPVDMLYPGSSPIAMDDGSGLVFVSASSYPGHDHVLVLNPATGRVLRTIATPAWPVAQVVDRRTRHVFVASANRLLMLDAHSEALASSMRIVPDPTSLSLDEHAGRVYVASSGSVTCTYNACTHQDGALRILDARTGRVLRMTILQGQAWVLAAIDGPAHRLVVAGGASAPYLDDVTLFDVPSGRLLGRMPLPGGFMVYDPPVVDEATGRAFVPVIAARNNASYVAVVDVQRSRLVRLVPLGRGAIEMAVDPRTERVVAATSGPTRPVTIRDGSTGGIGSYAIVQVPTGPGSVQILDGHTGALLRTIRIGLAITAVAVDERRGRVYVTSVGAIDATSGAFTGPGLLSVLDERSGKVVRTVAVGVDPVGVVVDRQRERLFVANAGTYGLRRLNDPWGWLPGWLRRRLPLPPLPQPRPFRVPASVSVLDTTHL